MTDAFTPEQRSRIMSKIRSRGNAATELRFVQILRTYQFKGWRRGAKLPGKPDFVFQRERVAVFVDGDFWHGNPRKFRLPKSNLSYWSKKILSNRARDKRINNELRMGGWIVLRFWQTSLKNEKVVISRLRRCLNIISKVPENGKVEAGLSTGEHEFYGMVADKPANYISKKKVNRKLVNRDATRNSK